MARAGDKRKREGDDTEDMPGRLIMDEEGARGSLDLKTDRSHAQEGVSHVQAQPVKAVAGSQLNGSAHNGSNGILTNGQAPEDQPPTTNGISDSMAIATSSADPPPPLDQSWRKGEQNKSLGLLMSRVAQQCYYDLNKTLDEMSAVPVTAQPPQQPNGVVPHTGPDTSDASLKKKGMLMNYANDQRDRFIKTLVLSDWSRNGAEKARLIDVKVWLDKQRDAYARAEDAVARVKMNMQQARVPNPNIEGAMEVLATGKASWVPDLGYIPPKRLSAKQLLKTLRSMNVTLATRLNLYEELPYYFQDYSIADGRATFTVKDEFEVDLSVADEDTVTQFYFIDIRLSFTPATAVLDERIRGFLEGKVNYQLATNGLQGCYDFLHNFVLTHKVDTLQDQALELIRGKWFDCVKAEKLRRSFVVQYWASAPGPKSWFEIGISSGKQRAVGTRRPATPHISLRWFQKGVEVKDHKLDFDWQNLDVERCLVQVIEKHSLKVLDDLRTRIGALAPANTPFKTRTSDAKSGPARKLLSLSLPSLKQPIDVHVEPVTGQFVVTPPSTASVKIERRLNNDPSADPARWLAGLPCAVVQGRVLKQAELLAWTPTTNLVRQDNLATIFGQKLQHFSIFTPSRAWGEKWALAVTFGLDGEKWWVVELDEKRSDQLETVGRVITKARAVEMPQAAQEDASSVSRATLLRVERRAVGDVALSTLSAQLQRENVAYTMQKLFLPSTGEEAERHNPISSTALFISFSKLMKSIQKGKWTPWANEMLRLTHHGVVYGNCASGEGDHKVRHDLRLSLEPGKLKELHTYIAQSKERDLAINSTGGVALRFITPFGQPFIREIRQRLQRIERIDHYAAVLRQRRFPCTYLGLSRVRFTYSKTPELSVELVFRTDGDGRTTLKFHPHDSNPHRRVRIMLEQAFNATQTNAFKIFTFVLLLTLPALQTFERLEEKELVRRVIAVHPRTATWFSIAYHAPLPQCTFTLRTKTRVEGEKKSVKWVISEFRSSTAGQNLSDDLASAIKALCRDKAEHWEGMGTAIIADARGAAEALEKLDEIVRSFEGAPKQPPAGEIAQPTQLSEPPKDAPKGSASIKQEPKKAKPAPAAAKPIKQEPDVIMLD